MTEDHTISAAESEAFTSGARLDIRPLMAAYMTCTMAMMAFVSLIGPIARSLHLAPWQAGAVVTVGGVLWMLFSRPWGALSDRRGRRMVLLMGVGGFMLAYWAMCALLIVSLQELPAAGLVFAGLLITRGAVGGFFAAIPAVSQALVADHVPPDQRAGTMASLGAANGVGLVVGPAVAAALAQYGLGLPLYVTALLPFLAFVILWRLLPRNEQKVGAASTALRLSDPRLRRPMIVAFAAMFSVAIGQITVGFFAIDRLQLEPAPAARAAGLALTLVGVGLIAAQLIVRKLHWTPQRLIRVGALVSAVGFGAVALVSTQWALMVCFFFAAAGMGWVFPAFSAMAANAVEPQEQGAAAGSVGAAQGLGIVLGPLAGSLLYELGPGIPYALVGVLLAFVALWTSQSAPRN
ncbi:MFS transporter [Achromobacter xylosoxidans]|uniref:MFS transporter n=2 Tax=Pseudomonadota TaxID=1224 RepID=UPI0005D901BB|nr:MFS transporter [Achromobacter xylosoxidans]EBY9794327.1 MFS transporter [Salmonella enterica subsp. enterica serovar Minnesota]EDY8730835.1 MFS transporter [Salmonella enterica]HBO0525587.1 MFS transporter [Pseudomonas aeruginosa]HBY2266951.1 MFS transporter [Klebsiella pneumoniae]HDN7360675.1 MFS transporter [Salmonella enterica subsp. enterica serovar Agona]